MVVTGDRNWRELFQQDINELFSLSVLITGDVAMAESALVASLVQLDANLPDGRAARSDVQWAVAKSSVDLTRQTQESGIETSPPLPSELQPVLRLERGLRCCFVLRILAKYSNGDCARLLDLEAEDVERLVPTALLRLSSAPSSGPEAQSVAV